MRIAHPILDATLEPSQVENAVIATFVAEGRLQTSYHSNVDDLHDLEEAVQNARKSALEPRAKIRQQFGRIAFKGARRTS